MPLTSDALSSAVAASYTAAMPTCINSRFSETVGGAVISHALIECICDAWVTVVKTPSLIPITYNGVAGPVAAVASPVPVTFPAATPQITTFIASMGWTGKNVMPFAKALVADVPNKTSTMATIQGIPAPLAAVGVGTPSAAKLSAKISLFATSFTAALNASIPAKLGANGLPLFTLTPQLTLLCTNLANVYATILASITFITNYTGAPIVPTAPLQIPNTGSIL